MTRRTAVLLMITGLVAAIVAVVCATSGVTATERVRRHFGINASTNDTIRTGLLLKVPVGTPASAIVDFLETHGVGHDSNTWTKRDEHEVQCQIESDGRAVSVESHFRIFFELDDSDRLREIRVTKSMLRL
jgi:hypothetical protein